MRTAQLVTAALVCLLARPSRAQQAFELDCTHVPQSCNNDCYASYVLGFPTTLNYDAPTDSQEATRRKGSGCSQSSGSNACGVHGLQAYNSSGNSCDEFPYASTTQGGKPGTALRCIASGDNSSEGAQLGNFYTASVADGGCGGKACEFTVFLSNYGNSQFCVSMGGSNDGYEFRRDSDGSYSTAKIKRSEGDDDDDDNDYSLHTPDPELTFPLHLRREFLLSSGKRALLLGSDLDATYDDTVVFGIDGPSYVVKELFGEEKSQALRPVS